MPRAGRLAEAYVTLGISGRMQDAGCAAGDRRPARALRMPWPWTVLCVCSAQHRPTAPAPTSLHSRSVTLSTFLTTPPEREPHSLPSSTASLSLHPSSPVPFYPDTPKHPHSTEHADDPRPVKSLLAVAPGQRFRRPDTKQRGPPTSHPPPPRGQQVTQHRGRLRRQIVSRPCRRPNFSLFLLAASQPVAFAVSTRFMTPHMSCCWPSGD